MNVLFDPNPFCFGSTSTMRAIIDELPEANVRVLATGPVEDLCDGLLAERHDSRDAAALRARPELLHWASVYVAISNNTNVDVAANAGIPIVFIDALFWMKRQRTRAMDVASAYIIERHPGVDAKLQQMAPRSALQVGPIVRTAVHAPDGQTPLFVNIGGASSPDLKPGVNTWYPHRVMVLADEIARHCDWPRVEVAMGRAASESVPRMQRASAITLPNAAYLERMRRSEVVLTSPGLNAPLEAFAAGVPVAFLPPQNLTQVLHLRAYVDAGLAPHGLALDDLIPSFEVLPSAPESEGTAKVLRALAQLDDGAWSQIRDVVQRQLRRLSEDGTDQVARQREWLASLGPNGARTAAEQIRGCAR